MPNINTPEKLKNEILSRLGSPIHTVEVTEDQVWRCIDRAVKKFTERHAEGTNRAYMVMMVSATEAASGIIQFTQPITAIQNVYPTSLSSTEWNQGSIYDAGWHMAADIMQSMYPGGGCSGGKNSILVNYEVFEQFMELNKNMLYPTADFHYNPLRKQLSIVSNMVENQLFIIDAYVATTVNVESSVLSNTQVLQEGGYQDFFNPNVHTGVTVYGSPGPVSPAQLPASPTRYFTQESFNSSWLQDYATALVKLQWSQNLMKYSGQPLPGGITVDAKEMKAEAKEEIKELDERLKSEEAPMEFWMA